MAKQTVAEWRASHKKCEFCQHFKFIGCRSPLSPYCTAKEKLVNENLPRIFCTLFELREG